jgi:hypothetical protein
LKDEGGMMNDETNHEEFVSRKRTQSAQKIFGLRWQSEAATPLFRRVAGISKRRGASLPAAVHNGSVAALLRYVPCVLWRPNLRQEDKQRRHREG